MADSTSFIRFTKTFKKYKKEFQPEVVDYVRTWASTERLLDFHEDLSIVKVTGTEAQIARLLETLKERYGYIPPEQRTESQAETPA